MGVAGGGAGVVVGRRSTSKRNPEVAVRALMGEENFCRFEGVASASNSSSSSSGMGPSNATLRLWLGVFVGERSALGARRADLDGDRVREREGVSAGGGIGGGIVTTRDCLVGDAVAALPGLRGDD